MSKSGLNSKTKREIAADGWTRSPKGSIREKNAFREWLALCTTEEHFGEIYLVADCKEQRQMIAERKSLVLGAK